MCLVKSYIFNISLVVRKKRSTPLLEQGIRRESVTLYNTMVSWFPKKLYLPETVSNQFLTARLVKFGFRLNSF